MNFNELYANFMNFIELLRTFANFYAKAVGKKASSKQRVNTFLCPLSSGVRVVLLSAPLRPSERGAGGGVLRPAFIRGLYRYCRRRLCVPAKGVQEAVALGMCDSDF